MGVSGGNSNASLLKSTLALLSRYRDVAQYASQKQELSCAFGARVTFSLRGQRER